MARSAKVFRFLVTIPAAHAPSPVKRDVEEQLQQILSRNFHGIKVTALTADELIIPKKMAGVK